MAYDYPSGKLILPRLLLLIVKLITISRVVYFSTSPELLNCEQLLPDRDRVEGDPTNSPLAPGHQARGIRVNVTS